MRQLKYELLKIFQNRLVLVLLIGFFMLNLPMFLWQTTTENRYNLDIANEYQKQEAYYKAMPFGEAYKLLEEKSKHAELFQLTIIANNPNILAEYNQAKESNALPTSSERGAIRQLYSQAVHINGYQDYIEGMKTQADKMSSVSIFNKPDTFSFRNIAKTPVDFEGNKNLPLSFGQSIGIVAFSGFFPTDIFVLFFILLVSVRLFGDEKEKGLLILVKSTANGRRKTILTKILTLTLVSTVISLIFYGTNMVATSQLFGFGDMSRPIQSMSEFGGCNLLITVGKYLFWFLIGKVLIVLVFAFIFAAVFSFFKNNAIAMLTIAGLICGFHFAYRYIPLLSVFNPIKFINPIAALDIMNVVSEYNNINLFGFPCDRIVGLTLVMSTIILLSSIAIVLLYLSKHSRRRHLKFLEKIKNRVQNILAKFNGINLFLHELRKLIFTRKMLLLPIVLVLLILNSIIKVEPIHSFDESVYTSYIEKMEGEFTKQKETFILNEQDRFNNIGIEANKLTKQLNDGIITQSNYDYEMFLLEAFQKRQTGFLKVVEQYNHVKSLHTNGIKAGFVNELSSNYVFNKASRDIFSGLILMMIAVIMTSVTFCQEYKRGMINILNPTRCGKGKLYAIKIAVATIFAACSMTIYIPQYINQFNFYSLGDLSLPMKNILLFADINLNISILNFMIISHVIQLVSCIVAVFLVAFISFKLKNQIAVIIISSAFLIIPLILCLCGVSFARYLPFANAFTINQSVRSGFDCIISCINLAVTLILGLIFARLSYLKFCNRKRGLGK